MVVSLVSLIKELSAPDHALIFIPSYWLTFLLTKSAGEASASIDSPSRASASCFAYRATSISFHSMLQGATRWVQAHLTEEVDACGSWHNPGRLLSQKVGQLQLSFFASDFRSTEYISHCSSESASQMIGSIFMARTQAGVVRRGTSSLGYEGRKGKLRTVGNQ